MRALVLSRALSSCYPFQTMIPPKVQASSSKLLHFAIRMTSTPESVTLSYFHFSRLSKLPFYNDNDNDNDVHLYSAGIHWHYVHGLFDKTEGKYYQLVNRSIS